jgi:hypothetical protein
MMDYLGNGYGEHGRYHLLLVGDRELGGYVRKMAQERSDLVWHQYCDSREFLSAFYTAAGVRRIEMLEKTQTPEQRRRRIVSHFSTNDTFDTRNPKGRYLSTPCNTFVSLMLGCAR